MINKTLFRSQSPVFDKMCSADFKEGQENRIVFSNFSSSTIETLVEYLKSGKITIAEENAIELSSLAHQYELPHFLEYSLCNIIIDQNNYEDVSRIAFKIKSSEILEALAKFFKASSLRIDSLIVMKKTFHHFFDRMKLKS